MSAQDARAILDEWSANRKLAGPPVISEISRLTRYEGLPANPGKQSQEPAKFENRLLGPTIPSNKLAALLGNCFASAQTNAQMGFGGYTVLKLAFDRCPVCKNPRKKFETRLNGVDRLSTRLEPDQKKKARSEQASWFQAGDALLLPVTVSC
jgi:hypothetical protein